MRFHPGAIEDAARGFAQYSYISPLLGKRFDAAVKDAIIGLQDFPHRFPVRIAGLHRAFVRDFPFHILFRVTDSEIVIVAIFAAHSNPILQRRGATASLQE